MAHRNFPFSILNFPLMTAWLKPAVFITCLVPAVQLAYKAYAGDLGANPIETITRFTGSWALIFLLTSLAVTPLRRLTGRNELIKFRRMLGLFAFFYASLHFATYIGLDLFFDFRAIGKDIIRQGLSHSWLWCRWRSRQLQQ
jgi:methionine sulfoxide reductase heme-binding subunit